MQDLANLHASNFDDLDGCNSGGIYVTSVSRVREGYGSNHLANETTNREVKPGQVQPFTTAQGPTRPLVESCEQPSSHCSDEAETDGSEHRDRAESGRSSRVSAHVASIPGLPGTSG